MQRTVNAQARLAAEGRATILQQTNVEPVKAYGNGVEVNAEGSTYRAPVVVISAGPWAG